MIIRLMLIMKDPEGKDVRLGLVNSFKELEMSEEKIQELMTVGFQTLDGRATPEEAMIYEDVNLLIAAYMKDTGTLMDGGELVEKKEYDILENPLVFAETFVGKIKHPTKPLEWPDVRDLLATELSGCKFKEKDEPGGDKVIHMPKGVTA